MRLRCLLQGHDDELWLDRVGLWLACRRCGHCSPGIPPYPRQERAEATPEPLSLTWGPPVGHPWWQGGIRVELQPHGWAWTMEV